MRQWQWVDYWSIKKDEKATKLLWLHISISPFRFSRVWWKLSTIAIRTIYHLLFQSWDKFDLSCRYECIFERSIDCRYKRRRLFKMQTVVQGKYPPWGVFRVSTHCNKCISRQNQLFRRMRRMYKLVAEQYERSRGFGSVICCQDNKLSASVWID